MIKKIYIFLFFTLVINAFAGTNWSGDRKKISIIYKILDPLRVTVTTPEKIVATRMDKSFSYSEKSSDKKALKVTVEAPYESGMLDNVLSKIYENVYFNLKNKGEFDLTLENTEEKIEARAYFVDEPYISKLEKKTYYTKEFSKTINGNSFNTTTNIDVDFLLPNSSLPIGVYRGTLGLEVWFGGTIE